MSLEEATDIKLLREKLDELRRKGFGPGSYKDEAAVKQGVVIPVLRKLGWDDENTEEVVPEYSTGKGRVDYALRVKGNAAIFIEVKKTSEDLSERHQEQLLDYAFREGIQLAILTNGSTWEFYLPLLGGKWHERKVLAIDLEHQDPKEAAERMVRLLSKDAISSGDAEKHARELHKSKQRKEKIDESLPEAWTRLIKRPDEMLVDLLAEETESICGFKPDAKRVKDFLKQVVEPPALPPALSRQSAPGEGQERTRRVKGGITQRELEPFILAALLELRGSASNRNVKQHVSQKAESRLTKVDYSKDRSGRVRWSYYCDWARNSLAERGLIKRNSPRGIWELTEEGIKEAQRIADRLNRN